MAALGATISGEDLALAGITGDLSAALNGLTWVEAKNKLSAIIGLASGNEALRRGGVTSYTLNGRSISVSLDQLKQAMEAMRIGLSYATGNGNGPRSVSVGFSS